LISRWSPVPKSQCLGYQQQQYEQQQHQHHHHHHHHHHQKLKQRTWKTVLTIRINTQPNTNIFSINYIWKGFKYNILFEF